MIDSFIHLVSSNKCPITMQAHSKAMNKLIETTDAWSEVVERIPDRTKVPNSKPISPDSKINACKAARGLLFLSFKEIFLSLFIWVKMGANFGTKSLLKKERMDFRGRLVFCFELRLRGMAPNIYALLLFVILWNRTDVRTSLADQVKAIIILLLFYEYQVSFFITQNFKYTI